MGVYVFPNLSPRPTSHIISLDHPHAPAPSILYPVSNIDWQFVSYMIVYMFQCHGPYILRERVSDKTCRQEEEKTSGTIEVLK